MVDEELYSMQNINASTQPSLLSRNYQERLQIMHTVQNNLRNPIEVIKERLLEIEALANQTPRRSERLKLKTAPRW